MAPAHALGGGKPVGSTAGLAATASTASRNGAERKEWSVSEDDIIREAVVTHGCRWRRIAAMLPGRSDDAVRNRWNRLKEMGISESATPNPAVAAAAPLRDAAAAASAHDATMADATAAPLLPTADAGGPSIHALPPLPLPLPEGVSRSAPPPKAKASAAGGGKGGSDKERTERVSWSKVEDETILRGVAELGHKWNRIAERLPGRTDHAIRNRFHRLSTLLEDRQRQQQRTLAPNMPLPVPMGMPMPAGGMPLVSTPQSLFTAGVDGVVPTSGEGNGYDTPIGSGEVTSPANSKVGA